MFISFNLFFFSFLLCLWLGFANVLCLFIYIFFFSFVPAALFCVFSMPLYFYYFSFFVPVAQFCLCSMLHDL